MLFRSARASAAQTAAPKAEPVKKATKTVAPLKVETKKTEPVKVETKKTEAVKVETKKVEPVKVETKKTETVKVETKKVEPVKVETKKTETIKVETAKSEPVRLENKRDDDRIYCERLARHLDELKWLYCELYQDNPYVTMHLNDLLKVLKKFYDMRGNALKESDLKREKDPTWYKRNDLTGMMMYVNAFAGTLSNLESKLDYVQECNVNYLHLMPLLDSPKGRSDGGYAVADFRKIQEELGTMDDFADLTAACHKRGINVCLDFVMNHTSEDHEWAKRARAGEKEYQDRYFFFDNYDIPSLYEQTCPEVFPTTAPGNFTWLEDLHKHVMTTFYPYQWDLNYRNPIVLNEMIFNMLYLANQGVDIVRLDAVPYIWKQLGTNCRNLPQVHTIVRIMRMVCEIVCPGILLLGEVVMAPEKVEVGWTIEVRPGDLIPLDGTVLEGETRVNTAPVTGEPVPVRAVPGTQLMSGCINESGRITMRVDKVLEESMVTKILDAVENAASSKPKIDRFITRFARVYTPIVVALALAVAIIPSLITGEWHKWIYTALTFLVISCPCALVLSVPLAFFSGIGNASKHGILLKGGRVIEALANVKAVALDKTGTITSGEFKVQNVETVGSHVSNAQLLSMAAAIEAVSTHPIATSIVSEAKEQGITVEASDFVQELAGEGMVGMTDGQQVLVGNRRLMERYAVQGYPTELAEYGTEVLVAEGNVYLGRIIIADEARPDSAEAIADLNGQDIKTVMLTGDAEASANYIAKETGVSAVRAQLLPQDKLSVVQDIRSEYGPTMFVGDGINDAPVLAGADVGGAMGSGADAAIEAADVVFMRPSLTAIAHILDLSKLCA